MNLSAHNYKNGTFNIFVLFANTIHKIATKIGKFDRLNSRKTENVSFSPCKKNGRQFPFGEGESGLGKNINQRNVLLNLLNLALKCM